MMQKWLIAILVGSFFTAGMASKAQTTAEPSSEVGAAQTPAPTPLPPLTPAPAVSAAKATDTFTYATKSLEKTSTENFAQWCANGNAACLAECAKKDGANCTSECATECSIVSWSIHADHYSADCGKFFVNQKGVLGPLSALVMNDVAADVTKNDMGAKGNKSLFLKDYADLEAPGVCPGFKCMNNFEKIYFWSFFFENMAHVESSCNPNQINDHKTVPNGPAVGLYQMESRQSVRAWRGAACSKPTAAQMMTPTVNTSCAIEIMREVLKHNNAVFGHRNAAGKLVKASYWAELDPPVAGKPITADGKHYQQMHSQYLKSYPACVKKCSP